MRIKATTLLTVVLLLLGMLLTGCAVEPKGEKPAEIPPKQLGQQSVGRKVTVYRVPADSSQYLVTEVIELKADKLSEPLAIVRELVGAKPTNAKTVNYFPQGTKVLAVTVSNNIAEVNFSKELLEVEKGDYNQHMMLIAVVNSLTEAKEIKKVRFLIEGKKVEVLGQLDLEEPWSRDVSYINKAEKVEK